MSAELIGRTLGEFEIESSIGRGSFAEVFLARQRSLRRNIALKVLETGLFTPSDNVTRFLREAEAMARLEHPHIVPVYAAGEEKPYHFFAMRLISGGSLRQAMQRGIRRRDALRWMYEICEALAYAHAHAVVHRDLKPSNVLIQDGAAVLVDFGLARLKDLSTITQSGAVLGTPLYMSPEQTMGEEAAAPSDVFSLGVMLFELLLGQHPFSPQVPRGTTRIEARAALFDLIRRSEFSLPTVMDPTFPPALEPILMKALHPDPAVRYVDAGAMLEQLRPVLQSFPETEMLVQIDLPELMSPQQSESTEATPAAVRASSGAHAPDGPPTSQFGRYQIRREIGHGGQGVVYQAYDPVVDRDIALKVLQVNAHDAEHMRTLLEHEARVTGRLSHPNIIQVYDYGMELEQPYLTMQYIAGPSLDGLLAEERPLPLPFVMHVIQQSAEALNFAHRSGVIHLDVKPGNLLIGASSRTLGPRQTQRYGELPFPHVYLSDFTMAAIRRDRPTQLRASVAVGSEHIRPRMMEGATAGTIPYAAPEQLSNDMAHCIGPACDLFSLGVVFHEMLTGVRLFQAEQLSITQMLVLRGHVAPPSARVRSLPPEVDELCMRMLARRVEDRLASAETVVHGATAILEKMER
jgi:serine/threonine protein kinase